MACSWYARLLIDAVLSARALAAARSVRGCLMAAGAAQVASMEQGGVVREGLDECKQQAKAILKKLSRRSPSRMSISAGSYVFKYVTVRMRAWLRVCGDVWFTGRGAAISSTATCAT